MQNSKNSDYTDHVYSKEELVGKYINFDVALYVASINVLKIEITPFPTRNGGVVMSANYEFYAQFKDGKRWIKDVAIWIGPEEELSTESLRTHILNEVIRARKELKNTRLNGTQG